MFWILCDSSILSDAAKKALLAGRGLFVSCLRGDSIDSAGQVFTGRQIRSVLGMSRNRKADPSLYLGGQGSFCDCWLHGWIEVRGVSSKECVASITLKECGNVCQTVLTACRLFVRNCDSAPRLIWQGAQSVRGSAPYLTSHQLLAGGARTGRMVSLPDSRSTCDVLMPGNSERRPTPAITLRERSGQGEVACSFPMDSNLHLTD